MQESLQASYYSKSIKTDRKTFNDSPRNLISQSVYRNERKRRHRRFFINSLCTDTPVFPCFTQLFLETKANKLYKRPPNRQKGWNEMCIKPSEYKMFHQKEIIVHYWGESEISSYSLTGSGTGVYSFTLLHNVAEIISRKCFSAEPHFSLHPSLQGSRQTSPV